MPNAPLILVIPGLSLPAQMLRDLSFDLTLPGLSRLLGEGMLDSADLSVDSAPLLQALLRPDQLTPAAPLRLLGLGHDPAHDYWLCLDPVHLSFRERSVVVKDPGGLTLDMADAQALREAVSPLFAEFGELSSAHPLHWHLRMSQPPPEFPSLPATVSSQSNVALCAERNWRRALNEAQMLLHIHPVNQVRAQRDLPPINSLWPWGGGRLPDSAPGLNGAHVLCTDDPLLRGFSRWAGARIDPAPVRFSENLLTHSEPCLVDLTSLRLPAQSGDALGWRESLSRIDQDWFEPLRQARERGQVRQAIHLVFPGRVSARTLTLPPPGLANTLRQRWRSLRTHPDSLKLDQLAERP